MPKKENLKNEPYMIKIKQKTKGVKYEKDYQNKKGS